MDRDKGGVSLMPVPLEQQIIQAALQAVAAHQRRHGAAPDLVPYQSGELPDVLIDQRPLAGPGSWWVQVNQVVAVVPAPPPPQWDDQLVELCLVWSIGGVPQIRVHPQYFAAHVAEVLAALEHVATGQHWTR